MVLTYDTDQKTAYLAEQIAELQDQGLYNQIRTIESAMDGHVAINGKRVLNFCANNYLGLANHPRLKEAAKKAIDEYGIGPGAVRTIAGTMSLHDELESRLAKFKKVEATVTLQSGFTANLATIPALVGRGDVIFSDRLNHASIIDGCRLSRATIVAYEHSNIDDLRQKIEETTEYNRRLIVTDGVFSMDGDIALLPELYEVANEHGIMLMVDDAHGEGVLGDGGRGIVAGKKVITDWIKQRGRPFLFSSAMTVPDVAACLEAVDMLESGDELVKRLWDNAAFLNDALTKMGFNTGASQTPIIPVILGEAPLAQEFSKHLMDAGVFAMAIGYPTVPKGTARIRVMNTAAHSQADLEDALSAFETVGKALNVI